MNNTILLYGGSVLEFEKRSQRDKQGAHPRRQGTPRQPYRGKTPRPVKPPRPQPRVQRRPEELKPIPIGKKCNPLCPFFRCGNRALTVMTKYESGKPVRIAFCRWIGDNCIGYQCQYAYCDRKALLPDGTCAFAVREEQEKKKTKDYLEELAEERMDEKARSILVRRLGRRDLEDLEF